MWRVFFISIHKYKDVSDIDCIITEFARLKGTHLALCFYVLDGVTVLPLFAVNSLYLTDNSGDRWVK